MEILIVFGNLNGSKTLSFSKFSLEIFLEIPIFYSSKTYLLMVKNALFTHWNEKIR